MRFGRRLPWYDIPRTIAAHGENKYHLARAHSYCRHTRSSAGSRATFFFPSSLTSNNCSQSKRIWYTWSSCLVLCPSRPFLSLVLSFSLYLYLSLLLFHSLFAYSKLGRAHHSAIRTRLRDDTRALVSTSGRAPHLRPQHEHDWSRAHLDSAPATIRSVCWTLRFDVEFEQHAFSAIRTFLTRTYSLQLEDLRQTPTKVIEIMSRMLTCLKESWTSMTVV